MKLIVVDCLRRWSWIYALGFLMAVVLDAAGLLLPPFGVFGPYFLAPMLGPLFVVGFDLMRGAAGVSIALPISARKVGLGYWIVGVCIPPILLSVALILANIVVLSFKPSATAGWQEVGLTFVISLLINGCVFFVLTILKTGPQEGFWNNVVSGLAGALWGVSAFSAIGIKFLLDSRKEDAALMANVVCVALVFGVLGYLRCGEVVRLRARNRIAAQRPARTVALEEAGAMSAKFGLSGLPCLFFEGMKFAWLIAVVLVLTGALLRSFMPVNPMFTYYALVFCAVLPSLRCLSSLRQMRALPISFNRFVLIIFMFPLVNLSVCLGIILLADAIIAPGHFNASRSGLLLSAGIASLGNSLAIRYGVKSLPVILGIGVVLLFWLQLQVSAGDWILSGFLMMAAFGILRLSLRCSNVYRLPAGMPIG